MTPVQYRQIPGGIDIKIIPGDYWSLGMTFKDGITKEPIDLSLYTFFAEVTNGDQQVQEISVIPIDLVNGKIAMRLTAIQTAALNTIYSYYLTLTNGGDVRRMLYGKFEAV